MSLNRLDETWLRTVVENALRRPQGERAEMISNACRDPVVSDALERTLAGLGTQDLETGGAMQGALWDDLLAVLGHGEDEGSGARRALHEEGPREERPREERPREERPRAERPRAERPREDPRSARAVSEPSSAEQAATAAEGARFGRLGRLRVERLLSSGGMGQVYEAYDELLERRVALKTLRSERRLSPSLRARFLREARLSSRLDHPHVCRLYDLVEDAGIEALVLELIEGQSLAERLSPRGSSSDGSEARSLGHREKLRIAQEIASGLTAAHEAGIVHRDLKPANIMLTRSDSVKIVDFGIARSEQGPPLPSRGRNDEGFSAFKTRHGTTLGTLAYMSPEQARCEEVGPPSDIFSFGLLLRELFTGNRSYRFANQAELWNKVAAGEFEGFVDLEEGLRSILDDMLDQDPAKRPPAFEVESALEDLAAPERPGSGLTVALGAVLTAALFLVLFLSFDRNGEEDPIFAVGETPRVAVLPIENRSGDDALSWVSTGLAEMVSEGLGGASGLEVIEFSSVRELASRLDPEMSVDAAMAVEALGADLVLEATLEPMSQGLFHFVYRIRRPGFASRPRGASGSDLFAAGAELAASVSRRIAPQSLLPDLREVFSKDPFVNQLYAIGLDNLRNEQGAAAEPFLRAVLELDPEALEARLGLADALNLTSEWDAAEAVADEVISRAGERPSILADAFTARATSAHGRDEFEAAAGWGEKAVQAAEASGENGRLAAAQHQLGRTLRFIDQGRAVDRFEQALELHRWAGNRLGEAKALHALGVLADEWRGDSEEATERFTAALEIAQKLEAPRLEAIVLDSLAIVATETGQLETATDLFVQSVAIHRRSGDRRALVFGLNNLGDMYQELQQLDLAEKILREGDELCQEIEAPSPCALLGFNFAEFLLLSGRPDEALPQLERSENFYGAADPDNLWLRGLYAAYQESIEAGRARLESACSAVDEARCSGYRQGFADVAARVSAVAR